VPHPRDEDCNSMSGSSHVRRAVVPQANDLAPSCPDDEPSGGGRRDFVVPQLPAVQLQEMDAPCASLACLVSDDLQQVLSAPATPPRSLFDIPIEQVRVLVPSMLDARCVLAVSSPWLHRCGHVQRELTSRCLRCALEARHLLQCGGAAWISLSTRAVRPKATTG